MNRFYALRDLPPNTDRGFDAARAFLEFPTTDGVNLRQNYIQMMHAVGDQLESGVPVDVLVGMLDVDKLKSSLKLFAEVSANGFDEEVHEVCVRCLKLLGEM